MRTMEIKRAERQKASPEMLRIANTILCNYSMVNKASLSDGRMGVCLFLYEYARLTEKKEYEELANLSPIVKFLKHEADQVNAFFINFSENTSE